MSLTRLENFKLKSLRRHSKFYFLQQVIKRYSTIGRVLFVMIWENSQLYKSSTNLLVLLFIIFKLLFYYYYDMMFYFFGVYCCVLSCMLWFFSTSVRTYTLNPIQHSLAKQLGQFTLPKTSHANKYSQFCERVYSNSPVETIWGSCLSIYLKNCHPKRREVASLSWNMDQGLVACGGENVLLKFWN